MTDTNPAFWKTDFHVHTPASVCYSDNSVKPVDIVEAALETGIHIMAIADHNTVKSIPEIVAAAEKRLVIIPGIEITTQSGHFLALFETDYSLSDMERLLEYTGIQKSGWGDAHTTAADDTLETLKKIKEFNGLAIAAHIDRWPSGLMESKKTRRYKQKVHESEYLDALEITIPENKQAWNNGEVRGFPMKRACTQGSDAHKPEEIGRRPVYLNMDKPDLKHIKQALDEFDERIVFPDEITG